MTYSLNIKPSNVMISNGKLKMNDFNMGFPVFFNATSKSGCDNLWPYRCEQKGVMSYWRSPEECGQQLARENSDTYSLGGV